MKKLILFLAALGCASCSSSIYSNFARDVDIILSASEECNFYFRKPSKAAKKFGKIKVVGDAGATQEDLINKARKMARREGADFILFEESGVSQSTIHVPGYASVNAYSGYARGAYSYEASFPWMLCSTWVYKSSLDRQVDKNT